MQHILSNFVWHDFWAALALVLVLEGALPFLRPAGWRGWIINIARQPDNALRIMGFGSMVAGLVLLYMVRQ